MEQTILFEESRKLSKWILLFFILAFLVLVYSVVQQVFYDHPLGSKPISDQHLIVFTVACSAFLLLLNSVQSNFKVTKDGFYLNLTPFNTGDLNRWTAVKEIKIEKYNPLKEYLGIGYRSRAAGMAFLPGSNPGIKLLMRNGDRLIIAVRNQEKLLHILKELHVITYNPSDTADF